MIVVDTNVISELMRSDPHPRVRAWVERQLPGGLTTTTITVAEIKVGLMRLPDGTRKTDLSRAAEAVLTRLADAIYPFDRACPDAYASIVTTRAALGRPISGFDAQIAAICQVRHAAIATRNVEDFSDIGLEVIDPWRE